MNPPYLQDAIDKAHGPVRMLWKPNTPPPAVPVLPPEYVGWAQEQAAFHRGARSAKRVNNATNKIYRAAGNSSLSTGSGYAKVAQARPCEYFGTINYSF